MAGKFPPPACHIGASARCVLISLLLFSDYLGIHISSALIWLDKAKRCQKSCIWMPAGGMKRAIHHHTAVTTGSSQLLQPDLLSLVKFPVSERDENSSHQ